jgi:hypothetical protein
VRLIFDGAVRRKAIRKLRRCLELAEDDYPSTDELKQQAVEEPVIVEEPETE